MTKHTPAPWIISPWNDDKITNKIGDDIAMLSSFSKRNDESLANARLIRTAPELLEALKLLVDAKTMRTEELVSKWGEDFRDQKDRLAFAQAVIKKAGGENE